MSGLLSPLPRLSLSLSLSFSFSLSHFSSLHICSIFCYTNRPVHWFCFSIIPVCMGLLPVMVQTFALTLCDLLTQLPTVVPSASQFKNFRGIWPSFVQIPLGPLGDMFTWIGILHSGTTDKVKLEVVGWGW